MKKFVIFLTIIIFTLFIFLIYNELAFLHVLVKFNDLEPIEKQMNVYFKGFKIGKTLKIYPDRDYKNTYIRLKIKPKNINLPENVKAQIKKGKGGNYINILQPNSPSVKRIKNNDIIFGVLTKDLNGIINDKLAEENIETIVDETTGVLEAANTTLKNLNQIFIEVNNILISSKNDIKIISTNLAKTSISLKNTAQKIENSIDSKKISASVDNIELITKNLNETTKQIDDLTIPAVNGILCTTNSAMKDINGITNGIKSTLEKKGGLRKLFFGRPISKKCD